LCVVGCHLCDGLAQEVCLHGVEPRIDLLDASLYVRTVAILDDSLHVARAVANDSAVPAWILQGGRNQPEARPRSIRRVDEIMEQLDRDQWTVAVEHNQATFERPVSLHGTPDGVARAALLRLQHHLDALSESGDELLLDVASAVTDHHQAASRAGIERGLHHPRHQGPARDLVQDLGPVALHPRAFARREDDSAPSGWGLGRHGFGSDGCG